ncbi:MAG: hypothetical protein HFH60_06050 [Lachnospiraceae bacterium]|nr:hypothetical protein [Lachnospiraceae bacterium]
MKNSVLAICDVERSYAYNFMEYMNQKRSVPFEIQAFTNVDSLLKFGSKEDIGILLISDTAMCSQVKELSVENIVILSEGVHDPQLDQYPSVYKYQSSAQVIREVMACYGEEALVANVQAMPNKHVDIIGVYSPLGRALKTSFALTLGQILARKKAALYINMEEFSGFEALFQRTFEHTLSDLLYYIRQENSHVACQLPAMVETVNNLDFLPPVATPQDIWGTSLEQWEKLLDELTMNSAYEVVVIDVGQGVEQWYQLLERCEKVYMPVLTDLISQGKIEQFERLLRMWKKQRLLDKIQKVRLPFHGSFGDGMDYVEQLPWSQLGDYVRSVLREEEE